MCSPPSASTIETISVDSALAGITWQVSTLVSISLFSGFSSVSTVPSGRASNAALTGASTVNGPSPDSVSTRPAA
ncbi:hypothetical protein D3C87_1744500 [compost metagenome]